MDDLVYIGNDLDMIYEFPYSMKEKFDMTNLDLMKYYFGIEVYQLESDSFISQKKYTKEILKKFKMDKSKPVSTPIEPGLKLTRAESSRKVDSNYIRQIVGSLMYLTTTRPDIMYSVSLISRYMESPTKVYLQENFALPE